MPDKGISRGESNKWWNDIAERYGFSESFTESYQTVFWQGYGNLDENSAVRDAARNLINDIIEDEYNLDEFMDWEEWRQMMGYNEQ